MSNVKTVAPQHNLRHDDAVLVALTAYDDVEL